MTRDQVFWSSYGGVCAVLAGIFLFWGGSLRSDLKDERTAWDQSSSQLTTMRALANNEKIPSEETIREWSAFNKWLAAQNKEVSDFFRQRDNNLEQKLVEGSADPEPGDFKSAYNDQYRHFHMVLRQRMSKGSLHVIGLETLFRKYPWMDTPTEPDPADYPDIRRDVWIREYFIMTLLLNHNVSEIRYFRVLPPEPTPIPDLHETRFRAIPVRVECVLPADSVVRLLTTMLTVRPSDTDKLFVILRELSLKKGAGAGEPPSPPVTLELLVDVIDFLPRT